MSANRLQSMRRRQAIVDFLDLRKIMLVLLTMVILVGLGEKMAERFLPLYLVALGHHLLAWIRLVTSPATNFLTAFGFGILGTLYFALRGKDLRSSQVMAD